MIIRSFYDEGTPGEPAPLDPVQLKAWIETERYDGSIIRRWHKAYGIGTYLNLPKVRQIPDLVRHPRYLKSHIWPHFTEGLAEFVEDKLARRDEYETALSRLEHTFVLGVGSNRKVESRFL